ncbi:tetratricopeptide repeat protein [Muriicola sp.]|uniref:tetratricopeptide repeat protein n=1 Tax=Muriicola sp. TaxID=2020856 RepID=UPI003C7502A5
MAVSVSNLIRNLSPSSKSIFGSLILSLPVMLLISSCDVGKSTPPSTPESFTTPLGKVYTRNKPSEKLLEQYYEAKKAYLKDTTDVDLLIWYGRRMAYLGNYEDAIAIYSMGIQRFPMEVRLYRHRGHRYITLREFDKAIADLEHGAILIQGTSNEIEPDGMPNAMNIPVSTLHGNIWYHLGLAYYLKHDFENAYRAYLNCRESGENPDNIVSSTHWLYMIQRRLGNTAIADSLLLPIEDGMEVIENTNYYDLCKFYKGLIPLDSLTKAKELSAASDAVSYGLANWYLYEGPQEKGLKLLNDIVGRDSWSSFGYIAAESDLGKITIRKGDHIISE